MAHRERQPLMFAWATRGATGHDFPLVLLFLGYPLWWILGVQEMMWPFSALLMVVWLVRNRSLVAFPHGFEFFVMFLGWVLLSAFMLTGPKYALAYVLRLVLYTSVFVIGVFVYTLSRHRDDLTQRALSLVTWVWACAIVLAIPAFFVAGVVVPSPMSLVVDAAGINQPYISALTTPKFGVLDPAYGVIRPTPLFAYTNIWGAAVGAMTPVAVYSAVTARTTAVRVLLWGLLAFSVWPIVVSVNRGLWVSLAVALAYVLVRRAASRDLVAVGLTMAGAAALVAVALFTPLDQVIVDRLAVSNTDTRSNLYTASLELAQESPIFGHGAPQDSSLVADNNNVSVGTHGQFWTILVSQGFVGVALFLLLLIVVWWRHRPLNGRSPTLWLHAIGPVVMFQILVYDVVPLPLTVLFIASAAIVARNRRLSDELAVQRGTDLVHLGA